MFVHPDCWWEQDRQINGMWYLTVCWKNNNEPYVIFLMSFSPTDDAAIIGLSRILTANPNSVQSEYRVQSSDQKMAKAATHVVNHQWVKSFPTGSQPSSAGVPHGWYEIYSHEGKRMSLHWTVSQHWMNQSLIKVVIIKTVLKRSRALIALM